MRRRWFQEVLASQERPASPVVVLAEVLRVWAPRPWRATRLILSCPGGVGFAVWEGPVGCDRRSVRAAAEKRR